MEVMGKRFRICTVNGQYTVTGIFTTKYYFLSGMSS